MSRSRTYGVSSAVVTPKPANAEQGQVLLAAAEEQGLWRSNNYGETWYRLEKLGMDTPTVVACCRDGEVIACGDYYSLKVSRDGGETWMTTLHDVNVMDVVISGDGKVVMAVCDGEIYVSENRGLSFDKRSNLTGVTSIALSRNYLGDRYVSMAVNGDKVCVSSNLFSSYSSRVYNKSAKRGVALSSDGGVATYADTSLYVAHKPFSGSFYSRSVQARVSVASVFLDERGENMIVSDNGRSYLYTVDSRRVTLSKSFIMPCCGMSSNGQVMVFRPNDRSIEITKDGAQTYKRLPLEWVSLNTTTSAGLLCVTLNY